MGMFYCFTILIYQWKGRANIWDRESQLANNGAPLSVKLVQLFNRLINERKASGGITQI
jgi:hypothetical protein